ncbi:IFT25 [Symbiodinium pilosum]|uniref:IFT25 protein n=1 Tax=Symbiodinium pilosum TaxID=2952 RepID=A0A812WV74_SYMPI|nr:IFT25 [Symbiodinium pilosum]
MQDEAAAFENCIGAGRLEGWFCTSSIDNEKKGWGHLESYSFPGHLFFHLQRSPSLRGVRYGKKDPVTFEVVEFNGRCEAVKLLLPSMQQEDPEEAWKPEPREVLGQTMEGRLSCNWQLVKAQNWGFVVSDFFRGTVFWHITDNPEMLDLEFSKDDVVEFELYINETRGDQVRARKLKFLRAAVKDPRDEKAEENSQKRMEKKRRWLENWRKGPPPDWDCKGCGYLNFGRNKICKTCSHPRPPREEWPAEEEEALQKAVAPNIQSLPAAFKCNLPVQFQPFVAAQPGQAQSKAPSVLGPGRMGQMGHVHPPEGLPTPGSCFAQPAQIAQPAQPSTWHDPSGLQNQLDNAMWLQTQQPCGLQQVMAMPATSAIPVISALPPAAPAVAATPAATTPADEACFRDFDKILQKRADTEDGVAANVKAYLDEMSKKLRDGKAKQAFAVQLSRHPWFAETGHELRFRPGMGKLDVALTPAARALKRKAGEQSNDFY